jgi:N-acetylmuramoyl-L-alanine amidase
MPPRLKLVFCYCSLALCLASLHALALARQGFVAGHPPFAAPMSAPNLLAFEEETPLPAAAHQADDGSPSQTAETSAEEDPPAPPPGDAGARTRPLVVVDAGHGGGDGGAVWNGIIEKDLTLKLALLLKAELEKGGAEVALTRSGDSYLTLGQRAARADKLRADALVSLHLNSTADNNRVRGMETYYSTGKSLAAARALQASLGLDSISGLRDLRGRRLAMHVQKAAVAATGTLDRGIKESAYIVLNHAACPAILIECGFISNPEEARRLKTESHQKKLVTGIAKGILDYLAERQKSDESLVEVPPVPAAETAATPKSEGTMID